MVQISSGLSINSLIWINSLEPESRGTTERVHDDLQPFCVSIGLPFRSFEPKTADELLALLAKIAGEAAEGLKPIIHFDTHGSANDGIFIAASKESVPWQRLVNSLRPINISTKNKLCVVSAACCSWETIKNITVTKPSPFFILVAPEETVTFGFIEDNTSRFYEKVFKELDLVSAHQECFAPKLKLFHCEKVLAVALTRYVRDNCKGKGGKERRENLMTQYFGETGLPNTRHNRQLIRKTAKATTRPNQKLIDRYVNTFLVGKRIDFGIDKLMTLVAEASAKREKLTPKVDKVKSPGRSAT